MYFYRAETKASSEKYYCPVGSAQANAAFEVSERDLFYSGQAGEIITNSESA
jgi:hypothetical protein